jgi:hypothetical protein
MCTRRSAAGAICTRDIACYNDGREDSLFRQLPVSTIRSPEESGEF